MTLRPLAVISAFAAAILLPGCLAVQDSGDLPLAKTGSGSTTQASGTGGGGSLPGPTPTPGQLEGFMSFDQQTGLIKGYAYQVGNPTALTVILYINGPAGTGTMMGSVLANGSPIGAPAGTGFSYQPSSIYVDSTPRKLYVYMVLPNATTGTLIGGSSVDYFAGPDAKGLSYFTSNLSNALSTQCAQCHGSLWGNYYNARSVLGNPSPISGGTATNNVLYMKASGLNHAGGNQCGGNNICSEIITWFGMDFGK